MIHTGAEDQCPVCGYSLERADIIFGKQPVEFTRVLDEAGALTHQDRQDLLRTLEDLERNVHPIALCIYITDDGRAQEFRSHAHWILNHARIHHPSFGRREKSQAIEDADLVERRTGERHRREPEPESWWQRWRRSLRDILHPYPPPVRQEWMLMLVLDVQLEMACFSWGYMLDPYINPDSINSCIMKARLQFRERAMTVGLKKVMKSAVNQIAVQSYRVNRKLRRLPHKLPLLLVGMSLLSTAAVAAPQSAATPWADDDVAEEVEDDASASRPPVPAVPPVPAKPGAKSSASGGPAAYDAAPRWSESDYRHLLSGELSGGYRMLASKAQAPAPGSGSSSGSSSQKPSVESDTKIPKHYYRDYGVAGESGVIDPQRLLSNPERADVEHALREQNAHSPYRLYVAVFRQGQELPLELAVGSLVHSLAQPGEYAAMIMYGLGDVPHIEMAPHEINLSDEDRHAWLEKMRRAAVSRGGGVEGLVAAMHALHACLAPVAEDLPPLVHRSDMQVPLMPLRLEPDPVKEMSLKEKLTIMLQDPQNRPTLIVLGVALFVALSAILLIVLRRRTGRLVVTEPDVRLASPYGAGVSRNVRYLEGKEMQKSPKIF